MALERIKITNLETNEAIDAQFNPTELTLTKGAQFAEIAIPGLDSPVLQFIPGVSETVSLELFFDATATPIDAAHPGPLTQTTRPTQQHTMAGPAQNPNTPVTLPPNTSHP